MWEEGKRLKSSKAHRVKKECIGMGEEEQQRILKQENWSLADVRNSRISDTPSGDGAC